MERLALFLAALWWGGISGISFAAVPMLFAKLGNPSVAGPVAAQLFTFQGYAGLVIGVALLLILRRDRAGASLRVDDDEVSQVANDVARMHHSLTTMGFVLLGMMLALLQEFGVASNIVTARSTGGNLRFWHGLGSLMVVGQWACAAAVLWRLGRPVAR